MPADVPPIEPPADDTVPARMRPVVTGRPKLSRRLVYPTIDVIATWHLG